MGATGLSPKSALVSLAVVAGIAANNPVTAQQIADASQLEEVVITGKIIYRNRVETTEPALQYDLEYFQRFEPQTVGDMMKRVPSVAFLGDVLEYDGVRLRGLDSGYTQILINGEKVPGAGVDRSFFVDRIPAELIERVEILRSNSANRSGDAVAGALNIVLRDAATLDGGYIRAGVARFNDDKYRETVGGVYGTELGQGRVLVGANIQGRRNPKEKFSLRYSEPPGTADTFDNREDQTDLRTSRDYSFNIDLDQKFGETDFSWDLFLVKTDRVQRENSIEYSALTGTQPALVETVNDQVVDIDQTSWNTSAKLKWPMMEGKTTIKIGYAKFKDENFDFEEEYEYLRDSVPFPEDDRYTGDQILYGITDDELEAKIEHRRDIGDKELEFGLQLRNKQRDSNILYDRNRITIGNAPAARPTIPGVFGPFVVGSVPGGVSTIEEDRLDPFVRLMGKSDSFNWEFGLRYETTETRVAIDPLDSSVNAASRDVSRDYNELLPSMHLRWTLSPADRIHASVARSIRRPNFDRLSPAVLEEELGDNDYVGNPTLLPETAWGIDIGYERRIGDAGVAGINIFYRDISDLLEDYNTGIEGSAGDDAFVVSTRNVGDGTVYGIELDLSTPLTAFGLENTGVFFNYSWLDSDVEDAFGSRKFNSQSDYVFNVGFIQELPSINASFGTTFRKQADAFQRIVAEEITTSYGGDLEAFIEKRFSKTFVARLTASNLLNSSKDEVFNKFSTLEDQIDRSFDEYEIETETAGPVIQLAFRLTF